MFWLLLVLGVAAIIANATMDEIQFRWARVFGHIAKPGTKLEKWMNPSISWYNKYKFKSRILNYLYGSVCAVITDFWHLLKGLFLGLIFSIILVTTGQAVDFWNFIVGILLLSGIWWFVFEMTQGALYGSISDLIKRKNVK